MQNARGYLSFDSEDGKIYEIQVVSWA